MKTKTPFKHPVLIKLLVILPVLFLMLSAIISCSASKKAARSQTIVAPPPPPPPPPVQKQVDDAEPFVMVEVMPMFPGGDPMLLKYIAENTKYPAVAKANNIQGRVIVRFCVTATGGVTRVSVLRGVDPSLDAEAIRVVETLPAFSPGKQGGKEVPVWYMVPITFTLTGDGPKQASRFQVTGSDTIYSYSKDMPRFPGGSEALQKFKTENIKYPVELKNLGVGGMVLVNVIVEKNGSLSDIAIQQGVSPTLDAEALRVTRLMPAWTPGMEAGKPVKFRYGIPYPFLITPQSGPADKEDAPYIVVEEMPMFPGGDSLLLAYIAKNTKYPESAKTAGIQGRVIARFCVTETGGIDKVSILKGVSPELDEEAMRVVKSLPAFKPGRQGGKAVSVWYMVPISFSLGIKSGEGKEGVPPPPPPPPPPPAGYDEPPVFTGGEAAMYKFIGSTLVYPAAAKESKTRKVGLMFCIDTDGSVSEARVVSSAESSLDAEAVRVVKLLPKWKPGKLAGKPVKVWYPVSVSFKLK